MRSSFGYYGSRGWQALETGRLLTFSFRALVLLLLLPVLWLTVAARYNEALVKLAGALVPGGLSLTAVGNHILIDDQRLASPVSIDAFTLHYGLLLLAVLVLAAVGIDVVPRLGWLLGMGLGAFVVHVIGVALLARGVAWALGGTSVQDPSSVVLGVFAVLWGLLPAIAGGSWCFGYWLPRASLRRADAAEIP